MALAGTETCFDLSARDPLYIVPRLTTFHVLPGSASVATLPRHIISLDAVKPPHQACRSPNVFQYIQGLGRTFFFKANSRLEVSISITHLSAGQSACTYSWRDG